jgi:hypothetical protein
LNKKIIAILLIAAIAVVSTVSASYYITSQPNQTQNKPTPTPKPTLMPTPTPTPMPTTSPTEEPSEPISIPKPSVPEFTLKLVDNSYDVPATYGIDQWTGETVVVEEGRHVSNISIVITIKNQAFTPCVGTDGNVTMLYYKVRVKGQFTENWTELNYYIEASDSEYTMKYYLYGRWSDQHVLMQIPWGSKVDFQVQALIGHVQAAYRDYAPWPYGYYEAFTGEKGEWSNTQTLTFS